MASYLNSRLGPRQRTVRLAGAAILAASVVSQPAGQQASNQAGGRPITGAVHTPLTNQDIIRLVKAGLSDGVVISAIQSAPERNFVLSPDALIALKSAGVTDAVLAAMQRAHSISPPAAGSAAGGSDAPTVNMVRVGAGGVVRLQLVTRSVSSKRVKVDQALEFTVADDFLSDGVLVVKRGTPAWGKVTKVTTQRLTRGGSIEFTIDAVKSISGQDLPLRGKHVIGGGRGMVFGDEAEIEAGAAFEAVIDREVTVTVGSKPVTLLSSSPPSPSGSPASTPGTASEAGASTTGMPARVRLRAAQLENGEPAVIETDLLLTDAATKVKAYFNQQSIDFTVNPETGRINTDWYGNRRCGPGIQHCENKASVRVTTEGGQTLLRIQVFERKREGGLSPKAWNENSTSRSKETSALAVALEVALRK